MLLLFFLLGKNVKRKRGKGRLIFILSFYLSLCFLARAVLHNEMNVIVYVPAQGKHQTVSSLCGEGLACCCKR